MVLTRSFKYYTWVVFFLSFLLFSSLFLFRSFFSLVLFCLSFFSLALSLSFALFPLSLPPPSLIVSYQLERTSLHVFGAPESAFVATAFGKAFAPAPRPAPGDAKMEKRWYDLPNQAGVSLADR